jgi:SAM-dependent methyltransferase
MIETSATPARQATTSPTDLLACPSCGSRLRENRTGRDLSCSGCAALIPFENGIYMFETAEADHRDAKKTISSFGRRWNAVFKRMGALTEFFLPSIQPVRKELFRDKVIVDGGGGFGRLSKLMLDYGARHVVLVDASDAVYAACEYLAPYRDRVTIVRANLLNPPLRAGSFDIFLCHGVLHHTGAPRRVLGNIARALDHARGITILWVYAKEGNRLLARLIAAARTVCASIGDKGRWMVASVVDFLFWALTSAVYRPLDRLFGVKDKLYYGEYFMDFLYDSAFNNRVDRLQMYHDFLTTPIVEYYSRDELEEWFGAAGFKKISLYFYRKQSWSIAASFDGDEDFSGRRP